MDRFAAVLQAVVSVLVIEDHTQSIQLTTPLLVGCTHQLVHYLGDKMPLAVTTGNNFYYRISSTGIGVACDSVYLNCIMLVPCL